MIVKKEEWMGMKIIIIMNKKYNCSKSELFDYMYSLNFLKINNY
jgi:hypothetical protein